MDPDFYPDKKDPESIEAFVDLFILCEKLIQVIKEHEEKIDEGKKKSIALLSLECKENVKKHLRKMEIECDFVKSKCKLKMAESLGRTLPLPTVALRNIIEHIVNEPWDVENCRFEEHGEEAKQMLNKMYRLVAEKYAVLRELLYEYAYGNAYGYAYAYCVRDIRIIPEDADSYWLPPQEDAME